MTARKRGSRSRFLTEDEKLSYFGKISKVDLETYFYNSMIRLYEGVEILLYHYDENMEVEVDTILVCTNMKADAQGIRATLFDKRQSKVMHIGEIPNPIRPYPIIGYMPYRCIFEKTVKETKGGRLMQGLTGAICFRTRSGPNYAKPGHVHAILLDRAARSFPPGALEKAFAKLEEE